MKPIIETKDLSHIYSQGTPFEHYALDHVNFSVMPGEFMGIIGPIDHWIAFILLAFIGGKMLWEAFTEDEDEDEGDGEDAEKIDLGEYMILAIATSIDALAVGISFAALSVDIMPAVSLIGITTFIFSVAGVAIGHTFGARYEKPATIVGGVVLIFIGLKILLEHLGILAI